MRIEWLDRRRYDELLAVDVGNHDHILVIVQKMTLRVDFDGDTAGVK